MYICSAYKQSNTRFLVLLWVNCIFPSPYIEDNPSLTQRIEGDYAGFDCHHLLLNITIVTRTARKESRYFSLGKIHMKRTKEILYAYWDG